MNDYERVQEVLLKTNWILAENVSLVKNLVELLVEVRQEAKKEKENV